MLFRAHFGAHFPSTPLSNENVPFLVVLISKWTGLDWTLLIAKWDWTGLHWTPFAFLAEVQRSPSGKGGREKSTGHVTFLISLHFRAMHDP